MDAPGDDVHEPTAGHEEQAAQQPPWYTALQNAAELPDPAAPFGQHQPGNPFLDPKSAPSPPPFPPSPPFAASGPTWPGRGPLVPALLVVIALLLVAVIALLATRPHSAPSTAQPAAAATTSAAGAPSPLADKPPSTSSGAAGDGAPASPNTYQLGYSDKSFILTQTDGGTCDQSDVDLDQDVPDVKLDEYGNERSGADLEYSGCGGNTLHRMHAEYFGAAPATKPDPADCAQDARSSAAGALEAKTLTEGSAFCVITNEHNVVWMKLAQKKVVGGPNSPDLVFHATIWRRAQT